MLDANLTAQLKAYLERVREPFEMVASLDDSQNARDMRELLEEITQLSPQITLRTDGQDARRPSFALNRIGAQMNLRFAAIPLGHEFTSLVLALLWVGGHPPKAEPEVIEQIKALDGDYTFEVYMSLTCHNCPDVVQALSLMAVHRMTCSWSAVALPALQRPCMRHARASAPVWRPSASAAR